MKVQAVIFAMAIAAVSAHPHQKTPTEHPVNTQEEPAVRANAYEAGRHGVQAVVDLGREMNANIVAPTADVAGTTGKYLGHGTAGFAKAAVGSGVKLFGNTVRIGSNAGKLVFAGIDSFVAEPALKASDRLATGAEYSGAQRELAGAHLHEKAEHGAEVVQDTAHGALRSVQETAEAAREKLSAKVEQGKENLRETRENLRSNTEETKKNAQAKIDETQAKLAEQNERAKHTGNSLLERVFRTSRNAEKHVAGTIAGAAYAVGDKASATEEHAADREHVHAKNVEVEVKKSGAAAAGLATAGLVAVLATAATFM